MIVVGKLTRSRVFKGGTGLRKTPRSRDEVRKFSQSCGMGRRGDGVRQNHAGWRRRPYPSDPPRPIAIPIEKDAVDSTPTIVATDWDSADFVAPIKSHSILDS